MSLALDELQENYRKLERRLVDLDDSCELRFGRLFKRASREDKSVEPVDPSPPAPSQSEGKPGGAAQRFAERRHRWA